MKRHSNSASSLSVASDPALLVLIAVDPLPEAPPTQLRGTAEPSHTHFEDHPHYRRMEKAEVPMGSEAMKSLGKQFQRRLRGCGQFWSRPGLTHLLQLCVLIKNQDIHLHWN